MEIRLNPNDLERWANDWICIQDAMPYLTPAERKFIMTGCTEEDWNTMFGGEE